MSAVRRQVVSVELCLPELLKGRGGRPCSDRAGDGGRSTSGEQGMKRVWIAVALPHGAHVHNTADEV